MNADIDIVKKFMAGHIYPPSHPSECQTTGKIIDLIRGGRFGTITFSGQDREIQTWIASNEDIQKLWDLLPSSSPDYYPCGAEHAKMILRADTSFTCDYMNKRTVSRSEWVRA